MGLRWVGMVRCCPISQPMGQQGHSRVPGGHQRLRGVLREELAVMGTRMWLQGDTSPELLPLGASGQPLPCVCEPCTNSSPAPAGLGAGGCGGTGRGAPVGRLWGALWVGDICHG